MNKKIISYSLFGNDPKYTMGAIYNSNLLTKEFPGWIMRIYHDNTVDSRLISELSSKENVECVMVKDTKYSWEGLFWRFYVIADETVDRFIIRDLDCRLNRSDKYCVDEWVSSKYPFHLARCVSVHNIEMLGGLWGAVRKELNIDKNGRSVYSNQRPSNIVKRQRKR